MLHDGLHDALYVLLPFWAQAFGLSLSQVGILKAAYSGVMGAFQMPAGLLAERYGERIVLMVGTVIAGIAYLLLGTAGGFAGLLLLLALAGVGGSAQHPLSATLVAKAYDAGRRRAAIGIYNFSGDLGKMTLPALMAVVAGAVGWRTGTLAYGILGIAAGGVIFVVLHRLGAGAPAGAAANPDGAATGGWGIVNKPAFRAISAINVIDTAVIYGFLTFLPFLLMEQGAAVESVGLAMALVFGGGAAGKFLCGVAAERVGIIRPAVLTILIKAAGILALLFLPLWAIFAVLPFLGIGLSGTSSVLYASVAEFVEPERHSRAFALFYTLGIGSGAVAPPVFGVLSDAAGVPVSLAALGLGATLMLPFCVMLAFATAPTARDKA